MRAAFQNNLKRRPFFMTGISNDAVMTVLAASHFNDKITAFAPVAGGDPTGTYFEMSKKRLIERKCGPGAFADLETNKEVQQRNACSSDDYPHEIKWPGIKCRIKFKQFYHKYDGAIHTSCMEKVRLHLIEQGYIDAGKFVLRRGYVLRNTET